MSTINLYTVEPEYYIIKKKIKGLNADILIEIMHIQSEGQKYAVIRYSDDLDELKRHTKSLLLENEIPIYEQGVFIQRTNVKDNHIIKE